MIDDNPLMANTTVIKLVTGLKDEDFVVVSYHNKVSASKLETDTNRLKGQLMQLYRPHIKNVHVRVHEVQSLLHEKLMLNELKLVPSPQSVFHVHLCVLRCTLVLFWESSSALLSC